MSHGDMHVHPVVLTICNVNASVLRKNVVCSIGTQAKQKQKNKSLNHRNFTRYVVIWWRNRGK